MANNLNKQSSINFDLSLLIIVATLLTFGIIMLASASIPLAEKHNLKSFYFLYNQLIYIGLGIGAMYIASKIEVISYKKYAVHVTLVTLALLLLLLIPGVTKPINGSLRWFRIAGITIQPSELAKLAIILYMASYMVRRRDKLTTLQGFIIPMLVLVAFAILLLKEPDFGTVVVIASTTLGMLFIGGVQLRHFLILVPFFCCILTYFSMSSSYRIQRLISFSNPWESQFDSGYQLVQSLIAFGEGSIFGRGLGGSVQKLLYLPESHSDFILAVIGEELGMLGVVFVISLYIMFGFRTFKIARNCVEAKSFFAANTAYGIGLMITLQALINVGVNIGLLPTKGLNLPLLSAGGSSMVITMLAIGIIFRISFELQTQSLPSD